MINQTSCLPRYVSQSLKLKKFYVQINSTKSIDAYLDLVLLTLDQNQNEIDSISLLSSIPINSYFIIRKDKVVNKITIWFDTIKLPENIFYIKLVSLKNFDSIEIKLTLYNELFFKKIYEYFYAYKFMENTLLKLKRNNDFFLYDDE